MNIFMDIKNKGKVKKAIFIIQYMLLSLLLLYGLKIGEKGHRSPDLILIIIFAAFVLSSIIYVVVAIDSQRELRKKNNNSINNRIMGTANLSRFIFIPGAGLLAIGLFYVGLKYISSIYVYLPVAIVVSFAISYGMFIIAKKFFEKKSI